MDANLGERRRIVISRLAGRRVAGLAMAGSLAFGVATASAAPDYSSGVASTVRSGFQSLLNSKAKHDQSRFPGARFIVTRVRCAQINVSETYKCLAYYTFRWRRLTQRYEAVVTAHVSGTRVFWKSPGSTRIG